MSTKEVHLLTKNPDKLRIARQTFDAFNISVLSLDFDMPEIQAMSSIEIARFAAVAAYRAFNLPVIREDHSFTLDDLGIPGPFMSYADKTVTAEQLVRIVDTLPSRDAHFEIAAAYVDENGELFEASYKVPVTISHAPRGDTQYNWERAIMLPGQNNTFAETPSSERDHLWSGNYKTIADYIITHS